MEFRPNASREISYKMPAGYVAPVNAATQMFYPTNLFIPVSESGYMFCYTPIKLRTFDLSSFYVVADDYFPVPKWLNSTFFLDRWAEYDKKKTR